MVCRLRSPWLPHTSRQALAERLWRSRLRTGQVVQGREGDVVVEAVVVGAVGALLVLLRGLRAALLALLGPRLLLLASLLRLLRWAAGKFDDDHPARKLHALGLVRFGEHFNVGVVDGEVHLLAFDQVLRHGLGLLAPERGIHPLSGALDVHAGRIQSAIEKCRNIWASLPGAGYGQHERKLDDLLAHHIAAGGRLA